MVKEFRFTLYLQINSLRFIDYLEKKTNIDDKNIDNCDYEE